MNRLTFSKSILLSALLLGVSALALPITTVSAWSVDHSAKSLCKDEEAVTTWSFTNTEPSDPKWSIDLTVTDVVSQNSITKTVVSGQTVSGGFTTKKSKIDAGEIEFKMLWTDGRQGVDIRKSAYEATDECKKPVEEPKDQPAFDAQIICRVVNNKAQFVLETKQTAGKKILITKPANGTVLSSGKAVTVTARYTDDAETVLVTKKTAEAKDCTPQTLSTNTEKETPKPAVLPSTGAGSIATIIGAIFVAGTMMAHVVQRKS